MSQVQSRTVGVPIGAPFNPAEIELAKIEQLRSLADAIFCRIAEVDERNKEIFKMDWTADFSKFVGREVTIEKTKPIVHEMLAVNLIIRRARGVPIIADLSLQQGWRAASASARCRDAWLISRPD